MNDKDPGFVPTGDLLRPLPPCGAGEEDFWLDACTTMHTGPMPPCVASEQDSKTAERRAKWHAPQQSPAEESDSPAGQAGRGLIRTKLSLAVNLLHLPDEPAGVVTRIRGTNSGHRTSSYISRR